MNKETDEASKKRLAHLEDEIARLEREFSDLEEIWKAEKAALQGTTHIKESLERARLELETARRAGDRARNRVWAERRQAQAVLQELLQRLLQRRPPFSQFIDIIHQDDGVVHNDSHQTGQSDKGSE